MLYKMYHVGVFAFFGATGLEQNSFQVGALFPS